VDEMYRKGGMDQTEKHKEISFFVVYLTMLSVFMIDIALDRCILQHE
jgi:hypothetical protein